MRNKIYSILVTILVLAALSTSLAPNVSAAIDTNDLRSDAVKIIDYAWTEAGYGSVSEWLDSGDLSEWYAFAILRHSHSHSDFEPDFDSYVKKLTKTLSSSTIPSAVERQRYALVLLFAGAEDSLFLAETPDLTIGKGGLISYVFGLHLLTNGVVSESYTPENVIDEILSRQLSDGGWAVSGTVSDPDVTAMVIQSLAPHRGINTVKASLDRAVMCLSDLQLGNGGYISYGVETPESAAQVIIALTSLGIDPIADERFVKDSSLLDVTESFACDGGGYSHTTGADANKTATVQVLLSKIALHRFYSGLSPLYAMDEDTSTDSDTQSTDDTIRADTSSDDSDDLIDTNDKAGHNTDIGADKSKPASYKSVAVIIILIAAGIAILILFLCGKRNIKNFAIIIVLALLAAAIVIFVDFSLPEDYYGTHESKDNIIGYVTVSIDASAALPLDTRNIIPSDGIILAPITLPIEEGDTAYDLTVEAARISGLNLDVAAGSSYVRGIANVYEFDFGELAGWTYLVNSVSHSVGCGEYVLSDGDTLIWYYALEPGRFPE